jgi:hypothetical protein
MSHPNDDGQVLGAILWDNLLATGTASLTGSEVSGFEKANAYDYQEFSLFRAPNGGTLDFTWATDQMIDCVAWYLVKPASAYSSYAITVSAQIGGTYYTLAAMTMSDGSAGELLRVKLINPIKLVAGQILRFAFTAPATMDVRELFVGRSMSFPTGQRDTATPFGFAGGGVAGTVVSVGGCVLARHLVRTTKTCKVQLEWLTEQWVQYEWNRFAAHARRKPFWYLWDYQYHPTHAVWAVAMDVPYPTLSTTPPYMEVTLPAAYSDGEVL